MEVILEKYRRTFTYFYGGKTYKATAMCNESGFCYEPPQFVKDKPYGLSVSDWVEISAPEKVGHSNFRINPMQIAWTMTCNDAHNTLLYAYHGQCLEVELVSGNGFIFEFVRSQKSIDGTELYSANYVKQYSK